jgi:hypothetical protein
MKDYKKVELIPNPNYPKKSEYEWVVLINDEPNMVNSFDATCPCYSIVKNIQDVGDVPIVIAEATELEFYTEFGKKFVSIR